MALLSHSLTTLNRAKSFMEIGGAQDDDLITSLINMVSDFAESYCDRRFLETAYSNELYDGNGFDKILLKQYPISSSETFTLQVRDSADNSGSFTTIPAQDYFIKYAQGIVQYVNGSFADIPQHYRASYTAGYAFDNDGGGATLESLSIGDLEYAIWKLITAAYKNRRVSPNVVSESIGDYSVTFRKQVMIDEELKAILDKYRRPSGM